MRDHMKRRGALPAAGDLPYFWRQLGNVLADVAVNRNDEHVVAQKAAEIHASPELGQRSETAQSG